MSKFTVKKGSHDFKPNPLKIWWKPKGLRGGTTFHEGCDYLLDNGDQDDWNKLVGLTWSIPNNKDAAMIAWRWNPALAKIEVAAYVNSNYEFEYHVLGQVDIGEFFNWEIQHDRKKKEYKFYFWKQTSATSHTVSTNNTACITRLITVWFGGNRTAPQDMSLDLNWIKI